MWGPSSNASGVAYMGFKVNSIFQILFFISFRKYMKNKGSTWWTGAHARLHVTKYDVLMLIPLHICSSRHIPSAFQDSGHGRCRWWCWKTSIPWLVVSPLGPDTTRLWLLRRTVRAGVHVRFPLLRWGFWLDAWLAWRDGISNISSVFHPHLDIIITLLACCNKLSLSSWWSLMINKNI
jgi:hypothetical protein